MFGNSGDESDTAKDAISDEMGMAMMNYLPLRGLVSFGGDDKTLRLIEDMLKSLNSQSVSGGSL
jgi:beta-glucosidase